MRLPLCGPLGDTLTADDGGIGGSAIDLYMSSSFYDDLAWAAAWLYRASRAALARLLRAANRHTTRNATDPRM